MAMKRRREKDSDPLTALFGISQREKNKDPFKDVERLFLGSPPKKKKKKKSIWD